jgi:translation initiation factor RLI1
MSHNRCGKCFTPNLELTRLSTEIPENQVVHRYHRVGVTVYHLKSPQDGYESLVVVPNEATSV